MNKTTERAKELAKKNGRDWNDMSGYEKQDYREEVMHDTPFGEQLDGGSEVDL
jgi:hypothetical protein